VPLLLLGEEEERGEDSERREGMREWADSDSNEEERIRSRSSDVSSLRRLSEERVCRGGVVIIVSKEGVVVIISCLFFS